MHSFRCYQNSAYCAAALCNVLFLVGCAALQTSATKDPGNAATAVGKSPPLVGVPYMLPRGFLQVGIAVKTSSDGKFESVDLKTETQLVPDESQLFLLGRSLDLLTHKDQKLTFTNGMLSTVTTKDDGQADEVLKALASIWLNTLKIGELNGTLGAMDALNLQVPASLTFRVANSVNTALSNASESSKAQELLTGYPELTAWLEVLNILAEIDKFYPAAQAKSQTRQRSTRAEQESLLATGLTSAPPILWDTRPAPANQGYGKYFVFELTSSDPVSAGNATTTGVTTGKQNGIYVKVPRPAVFEAKLLLSLKELYLYRLSQYDVELTALRKRIDKTTAQKAEWETRVGQLDALIAAINKKIDELKRDIAALPSGADPKHLTASLEAQGQLLAASEAEKAEIEAKLKAITDDERRRSNVRDEVQVNLVLLYELVQTPQPDDVVFKRKAFALVPSDYAVNVPLENALLGRTTYDLKLDYGVLTSYNFEKPAFLVELVNIPLDIIGAVIDQLTQLIQLRIDLSGKEKAYAQALIDHEKVRFELMMLGEKQRQDALKAQLALEKAMLDLQTANVKASTDLQKALVEQMSAAQIADITQQNVLSGLRADIMEQRAKAVESEKKIEELRKQIEAIRNPPPSAPVTPKQ